MAFAFRRKTMAGAVVLVTTVSMAIAGCATNDPESVNSPSKSAASAAQSSMAPASKTPGAKPSVSSGANAPAGMPSGPVPSGKFGVGAAVTKPDCAEPPSNYSSLKAPGTVVKDIDGLEPGTNHGTAADKYAYPAAVVNQWLKKPSTQPKNKKIVFVTFDDGPTTKFTGEQLDNLEKAGARATFFMIAPQLRDVNKEMLSRSLKMGNALAIHSYSHDYNYLYPGQAADAKHIGCDWDWATAQTRAILGSNYYSSAFRYPGGHMSWHKLAAADQALAKRGVAWIDWNAMSGDADVQRPKTVDGYLKMVKKTINESGDPNVVVILNHDTYGKQMTAEAMPSILKWLKSEGYEFGVIA